MESLQMCQECNWYIDFNDSNIDHLVLYCILCNNDEFIYFYHPWEFYPYAIGIPRIYTSYENYKDLEKLINEK